MKKLQFRIRNRERKVLARASLVILCRLENGEFWKSEQLQADNSGRIWYEMDDKLFSQLDLQTLKFDLQHKGEKLRYKHAPPKEMNPGMVMIDIIARENSEEPDTRTKDINILVRLLSEEDKTPVVAGRVLISWMSKAGRKEQVRSEATNEQGSAIVAFEKNQFAEVDWKEAEFWVKHKTRDFSRVAMAAGDLQKADQGEYSYVLELVAREVVTEEKSLTLMTVLVDDKNRPIPSATVKVHWDDAKGSKQSISLEKTDSSGRSPSKHKESLLSEIPWTKASYSVSHDTREFEGVTFNGPRKWDGEADFLLDLTANEKVKVDPVVDPIEGRRVRVRGEMFQLNGQELVGADVLISQADLLDEALKTGQDGEFYFTLTEKDFSGMNWDSVVFKTSLNGQVFEVSRRGRLVEIGHGMWGWKIYVDAESVPVTDPPRPNLELFQDDGRWRIRGKLTEADGKPARARVSAVAMRLSGPLGLGDAITNEDTGTYVIEFDWPHDCTPDLQVTADVEGKEIAKSPIHFNAGRNTRIDLVVDGQNYRGPSEFETTEAAVLRCNDDFDIEKIGSPEIEYLLGKTKLSERLLRSYLMARRLKAFSGQSAELFYGLFRVGLPTSMEGLVKQNLGKIRSGLESAAKQNIIGPRFSKRAESFHTALRSMAVSGLLISNGSDDEADISDLLASAGLSGESSRALAQVYVEQDGDDEAFWKVVGTDNRFKEAESRIKLALQAGALCSYYKPTLTLLTNQIGDNGSVRDLASWNDSQWKKFEGSLESVPENVDGGDLGKKIALHVGAMRKLVRLSFPREHMSSRLLGSELFKSPSLAKFLGEKPDFDFSTSDVKNEVETSGIPEKDRGGLKQTLLEVQRVYKLAPAERKFEVAEELVSGGITSAARIHRMGVTRFVDAFGGKLGKDTALQVYQNARNVASVSTALYASHKEIGAASQIFAIGGGKKTNAKGEKKELPTYADLFGGQTFCACEHCSSVYSPSAYLADLLEYLDQSLVTKEVDGDDYVNLPGGGRKTGLDVLFSRRSDIGDILLNCKNTNTVMPYVDLVNEILEQEVAGSGLKAKHQTSWSAEELRANPEHREERAYETLAKSTYPFSAPFRLWNHETDQYLGELGISRSTLMRDIHGRGRASGREFEISNLAYLGLNTLDVEILLDGPSSDLDVLATLWGANGTGWRAELSSIPDFMARAQLTYSELQSLLGVPYIAYFGEIGIDFSESETACDLAGAKLRYFDGSRFDTILLSKETLGAMQAFLRLKLKTGWSIFELGRVLHILRTQKIKKSTLYQISVIKQICDEEGLPVLEAASWLGMLDSAADGADPASRSFYESNFMNPAVLNPPDTALQIDPSNGGELAVEAAEGTKILSHLSSVSAGLQLSESDTSLLVSALEEDMGGDDSLSLVNLSHLFRVASLCRVLELSISDYLICRRLIAVDPWDHGEAWKLLRFMEDVRFIYSSGFSVSELAYLFLHDPAAVALFEKPISEKELILIDIQKAVRGAWSKYEVNNTPLADQLSERLGEFFDEESVSWISEKIVADRNAQETEELESNFDFLDPDSVSAALAQTSGEDSNERISRMLNLLNAYGRNIASEAAVCQVVSSAYGIGQAEASALLTAVFVKNNGDFEELMDPFLEPLFVIGGREKLAGMLPEEELLTLLAIIEKSTSLSVEDQESFLRDTIEFLDGDEIVAILLGGEALELVSDRYLAVTSALDDSIYAFTETLFADAFKALHRFQKAAWAVERLEISEVSIRFLDDYAQNVGVLDFKEFPFTKQNRNSEGFEAWLALGRLLDLRDGFKESEVELINFLEMALEVTSINTALYEAEIDGWIARGGDGSIDRRVLTWLYQWSLATEASLADLVTVAKSDWLGLGVADLQREEALSYVATITSLAKRMGTSAEQLKLWSKLDLKPEDAARAVQVARAKYPMEQWYKVAQKLRDPLREMQRDALTDFLVTKNGFSNKTQLYNRYLIDVEMSACMLTSRIKLALSSVQLFLQRCLLGIEEDFVEVTRPDEWDWRKNYRVWEANRKVFLYPENWIEPELRINRSEIFDESQNVLLQNEVTSEIAEKATRVYLDGLDEISNIEVLGSFQETEPDCLLVVARTRGLPRTYFYRVREGQAWLPWEEIDVELDAEQVLPVVIDSRLYLFWPEFMPKQAKVSEILDLTRIEDMAKDWVYDNSLDLYYNYLLDFNPVIGTSLKNRGFSSFEAYSLHVGQGIDFAIFRTIVKGAKNWDEFSASERTDKYEEISNEVINYFQIHISISEYKNGKWSESKKSKEFMESDKIRLASLVLAGVNPVKVEDFHFYSTRSTGQARVECVQSIRHLDGSIHRFEEGHFEYDAASKSVTASDAIDGLGWLAVFIPVAGLILERPLAELTGSEVYSNAFIEDEKGFLEIPEISQGSATAFAKLLERTPGTYRVPIQHQYDQFSSKENFFYGDHQKNYIVSDRELFLLSSSIQKSGSVGRYLASKNPQLAKKTKSEAFPVKRSTSSRGKGSKRGATIVDWDIKLPPVNEAFPINSSKYAFAPIYHPLVGELIKTMNREGVRAVYSRDLQQYSEEYFAARYRPTSRVSSSYPIKQFSFNETDANGFYNWEFFFHFPLLVATQLSKNQQFAEAQKWFHAIFDPTSRKGGSGAERFWQFKPFFDLYSEDVGHPTQSLYRTLAALSADVSVADDDTLTLKTQVEAQIEHWLAHPFDPHAVAGMRPVAYMKATVMKYLENLIAWGDHLYSQFTIESINEATQYYLLAYQILGDRPVEVASVDGIERSYRDLGEFDAFSNAVAQLENEISLPEGAAIPGSGLQPLYFCIPNNPQLVQFWDTVEDRLFKIRHCMTIDGQVRQLPLFQPPIDPALLVRAAASGVSIGSALAGLSMPAPHYRFGYLTQKAAEYCGIVKSLGNQLLSALEKKDGEELGLLRAEHEDEILKLSKEIKSLQVDEARENLSATEKSKILIEERIAYYSEVQKRSDKERASISKQDEAERKRKLSAGREKAAAIAHIFPNLSFTIELPPSFSTGFGGSNIGSAFNAIAGIHRSESAAATHSASKLSTDASYERRWDDWKLQERLATKELKQAEEQIAAAEVRLALAEKDRDNHFIQIEQSREVRDTMLRKFTNKDLFTWMSSQVSSIYFQSYKLAYDLAKRAEKAAQRELGEHSTSFIAYGYWDSLKKGLMSGERLQHDLQRLESHYLNNNRRELELTKNVSLAQLNPEALLELQNQGICFIDLPETLFDLDYPGHYFRRIKNVSLTIPAITGPYTTLSSTLTLVNNRYRKEPKSGVGDELFRFDVGAMESIATSRAQGDTGLFQLDFRDERYLPFEGAGALSSWKLELIDPNLAQFDYKTISDVILTINYTARNGGEVFRTQVETELKGVIETLLDDEEGLMQSFSIRQDSPDAWSRFSDPSGLSDTDSLPVRLTMDRFPYFVRQRGIDIAGLHVLVIPTDGTTLDPNTMGSVVLNDSSGTLISTAEADSSNFLPHPTLGVPSASLALQSEIGAGDYSLQFDELERELLGTSIRDILVVCSYRARAVDNA